MAESLSRLKQRCYTIFVRICCSKENYTVKAKFHYTIWFEACSKLVADRFEADSKLVSDL